MAKDAPRLRRQAVSVLRVAAVTTAAVAIAACESAAPLRTTADPTRTPTPTATVTAAAIDVDAAYLEEQTAKIYFPDDVGAAMIAVVGADGTVAHASRGADPDGNVPSPHDVYRIGSITKVFTAVLTLTLVEDGLVDLDAPAAAYITRVPVHERVTVRDLLAHRSGIPDVGGTLEGRAQMRRGDPTEVRTPEAVLAPVLDADPQFEPGARVEYSNTNYLLLGILIEEVTGSPYHAEMRQRLLDPRSLDRTYLAGHEDGPAPFPAYSGLRGPLAPIDFDYTAVATSAWAAGGMVSSAEDLHAFLGALFTGRILSPASVAAMTADEHELGMQRTLGSDRGLWGHAGGVPGYVTLVAHAPATRTTAFWVGTSDGIDVRWSVESVAERLEG